MLFFEIRKYGSKKLINIDANLFFGGSSGLAEEEGGEEEEQLHL